MYLRRLSSAPSWRPHPQFTLNDTRFVATCSAKPALLLSPEQSPLLAPVGEPTSAAAAWPQGNAVAGVPQPVNTQTLQRRSLEAQLSLCEVSAGCNNDQGEHAAPSVASPRSSRVSCVAHERSFDTGVETRCGTALWAMHSIHVVVGFPTGRRRRDPRVSLIPCDLSRVQCDSD